MIRKTATIAVGAVLSSNVDGEGHPLLFVGLDSVFTGASLKFQMTDDGTNWWEVQKAGSDFVLTLAASKFGAILQDDFRNMQVFRVVANTNQLTTPTTLVFLFDDNIPG